MSSGLGYGDRMSWFADLSTYTYLPETLPPGREVLTVGWLEPEYPFPTGEVPKEFADELTLICATKSYAQTRGFHDCGLPHGDDESEELFSITLGGERKLLGSAEVRVLAESGAILAAPDLVWHYVNYHHYLPPQDFIDAVLARRPGPPDYNAYHK